MKLVHLIRISHMGENRKVPAVLLPGYVQGYFSFFSLDKKYIDNWLGDTKTFGPVFQAVNQKQTCTVMCDDQNCDV